MNESALHTTRLDLRPLPAAVARALPHDRETAALLLGLTLPAAWPQADLFDVLPIHAAARSEELFGVWVMIERESETVIGDIGFMGPPGEDGTVEIGYSVIPDRRGRGYATEAARVMVDWALAQPRVRAVVAGCSRENVPSVHVLERVGFVCTSETDGQLRWRLQGPRRAQR